MAGGIALSRSTFELIKMIESHLLIHFEGNRVRFYEGSVENLIKSGQVWRMMPDWIRKNTKNSKYGTVSIFIIKSDNITCIST